TFTLLSASGNQFTYQAATAGAGNYWWGGGAQSQIPDSSGGTARDISGTGVTLVKTGTGTLSFNAANHNYIAGLSIKDGTAIANTFGHYVAYNGGNAVTVNIGDGIGAANSAVLRFINSDFQLWWGAQTTNINSDGLLDLNGRSAHLQGINLFSGHITAPAGPG